MRVSKQPQMPILALLLVAVFGLQAFNLVGSDETKTIGNTVVRIVVVGGKTYISVKSGGPLVLKYADGKEMCSIPDGTAMMVSGLTGAPTVDGTALKLAPLMSPLRGQGTEFSVALSPQSKASITCNGPFKENTGTFTVSPDKSTRVQLAYGFHDFKLGRKKVWTASFYSATATEGQDVAGTDRDQLSNIGG